MSKPEFEQHLDLAEYFTKKFKGYVKHAGALAEDDLYSTALLALHIATQTFDPEKATFRTYASRLIQRELSNLIMNYGCNIKIPTKAKVAMNKVDRAIDEGVLERQIESGEISKSDLDYHSHKLTRDELQDTLTVNDEQLADDVEAMSIHLKQLTLVEQLIITSFFGIGREKQSADELASLLNLNIVTVHLKKRTALKKLKKLMHDQ